MAPKVYGFVPARGGSVEIPDKNLKEVGGKPLVVRAVETLKELSELAGVILSTDSERIAELGRAAGAMVPFLRPPHLSGPRSPVLAALNHALAELERTGIEVERFVMVQPTSPFVRPETVSAVLAHARRFDLPVVQTVSPVKEHPSWIRIPGRLRMYPFRPTFGSLRRQDLPPLVILNGAVNVYRSDVIREQKLPPYPGYFIIDRIEGFDVDDETDLTLARLLAADRERVARSVEEPANVPD